MYSSSYNINNNRGKGDLVRVEKQFTAFFNSDPRSGSTPVGTLGNAFEVQLNNAINIPRDALNCTLEVVQAQIWNTSPNISSAIGNNVITFTYNGTPYTFTIPDGLYGIAELNSSLLLFFQAQNPPLPDNLFQLTANESTQKVIITFGDSGCQITFGSNSPYEVLGFNQGDIVPPVPSSNPPQNIIAPNVAGFNRINTYYIKTNLISGGIPQNIFSTGIIAQVPITSSVGDLIIYQPFNPMKSDATELIGNSKQRFAFSLVDQLERNVEVIEPFNLSILIRYFVKE